MELTEDRVKCLLNGKNLNKLDEQTFDKILQVAVSRACGKPNAEALTNITDSKPDDVKIAFAELLKLLIESARNDIEIEELNLLLTCTNLSQNYIEKFCESYASCKEELVETLESIGDDLPHIVDVDWQLDYCIKSNIESPAGFPKFFVSLSTVKHGKLQQFKFCCTIQALQDLVYKLKDAARHVERLSSV
ncbi:hypothetical protein QAD02_016141 [Eretmocerus hayati]|uniref:Uncharacterized protein n=1 Tax=Eretmocerus hayati TaxID=131215 RepID=A0ACC2PAN0_9HYME|nr:hypothetical protein QAD02_016141 [Eretmocerus hayati]